VARNHNEQAKARKCYYSHKHEPLYVRTEVLGLSVAGPLRYLAMIFVLIQKRNEETDGRTKKADSEVVWRRYVPNWSKMDLEIGR